MDGPHREGETHIFKIIKMKKMNKKSYWEYLQEFKATNSNTRFQK